MNYKLYDVCAICGKVFGYHKADGELCPIGDPDEQIFDDSRKWAETKFKDIEKEPLK